MYLWIFTYTSSRNLRNTRLSYYGLILFDSNFWSKWFRFCSKWRQLVSTDGEITWPHSDRKKISISNFYKIIRYVSEHLRSFACEIRYLSITRVLHSLFQLNKVIFSRFRGKFSSQSLILSFCVSKTLVVLLGSRKMAWLYGQKYAVYSPYKDFWLAITFFQAWIGTINLTLEILYVVFV